MDRLALTFLMIAVVASLFGFGLIGDFTFDIAKIVFFVFLMLAVASLFADAILGRFADPI